jgi:site-specific recombinase XerD
MTSLRRRMLEDMQIRNLAVNTQEAYVQQVSLFARYFNQSPERLGPEQIRAYQVYLMKEKKLATGSILIAVSALRFLYNIKSPSRRTGLSKTSSPLRKSLRPYLWSSVPRKSYSFLPVWLAGSTVPS